jgi:hypothetical protein
MQRLADAWANAVEGVPLDVLEEEVFEDAPVAEIIDPQHRVLHQIPELIVSKLDSWRDLVSLLQLRRWETESQKLAADALWLHYARMVYRVEGDPARFDQWFIKLRDLRQEMRVKRLDVTSFWLRGFGYLSLAVRVGIARCATVMASWQQWTQYGRHFRAGAPSPMSAYALTMDAYDNWTSEEMEKYADEHAHPRTDALVMDAHFFGERGLSLKDKAGPVLYKEGIITFRVMRVRDEYIGILKAVAMNVVRALVELPVISNDEVAKALGLSMYDQAHHPVVNYLAGARAHPWELHGAFTPPRPKEPIVLYKGNYV